MKEFHEHKQDSVICRQCGHQVLVPSGTLTESQKVNWLCEACLESPVVENQVQYRKAHQGGRRTLTEDLPNLD